MGKANLKCCRGNIPGIFLLALSVFCLGGTSTPAQEKNNMDDSAFLRQYAETQGFLRGRPGQFAFHPKDNFLFFLRTNGESKAQRLYRMDWFAGKVEEWLSSETILGAAEEALSPEEKARRERLRLTASGLASFQLTPDGSQILVPLSGKLYISDSATKAIKQLKTGAGAIIDPRLSPDGQKVAYVRQHNLYSYDLKADTETALTQAGSEVKSFGQAEFVAQEEMDRMHGFWWSPESDAICFQESDHSAVEQWFVGDPAKPERTALPQYYPRPGKANVAVRLGIVPLAKPRDIQWLNFPDKWEYLADVRWGRGGLLILWQNRSQTRQTRYLVDPKTGEARAILSEGDGKRFLNLRPKSFQFIQDDQAFLQIEEEHGDQPRLVIRTLDGKILQSNVDTASANVHSLVRASEDGNEAIFMAQNPTEPDSQSIVRAGKLLPDQFRTSPVHLTERTGIHTAVVRKDMRFAVFTRTSWEGMPVSQVVDLQEPTRRWLIPSVAQEPPIKLKVERLFHGDPEPLRMILKPKDFQAGKKYPVILYVYGGPHHQTVLQQMRSFLLPQWLANQGFLVVAADNRGTPGRGVAWEQAIHGAFGSVPLQDQIDALKLSAKQCPEMDLTRVGVYGWSFGGYMAAQCVLKRPDVFAAGIAGAPVTDWDDYDSHYTERYMGDRKTNSKAYDEANLLNFADKLSRPLLLVHGTADDNVYYRHSLRLADACFRAGKRVDHLPLPGMTHMTPDPVITQRLWERYRDYFRQHLGEPR